MNTISYRRLSFVVSLTTLTVLGSGFKAQSETIASHLAESASVTSTSFRVAQVTEPPPSTPDPTAPAPTAPPPTVSFADVDPNYWAYPFIQALASDNAIAGFPDGSFRPEQPVSRAEFAAMIQKAVNPTPVRQLSPGAFVDVPADYWAASAITAAYEGRFMDGYPNNTFQPKQEIPKAQAITALHLFSNG